MTGWKTFNLTKRAIGSLCITCASWKGARRDHEVLHHSAGLLTKSVGPAEPSRYAG